MKCDARSDVMVENVLSENMATSRRFSWSSSSIGSFSGISEESLAPNEEFDSHVYLQPFPVVFSCMETCPNDQEIINLMAMNPPIHFQLDQSTRPWTKETLREELTIATEHAKILDSVPGWDKGQSVHLFTSRYSQPSLSEHEVRKQQNIVIFQDNLNIVKGVLKTFKIYEDKGRKSISMFDLRRAGANAPDSPFKRTLSSSDLGQPDCANGKLKHLSPLPEGHYFNKELADRPSDIPVVKDLSSRVMEVMRNLPPNISSVIENLAISGFKASEKINSCASAQASPKKVAAPKRVSCATNKDSNLGEICNKSDITDESVIEITLDSESSDDDISIVSNSVPTVKIPLLQQNSKETVDNGPFCARDNANIVQNGKETVPKYDAVAYTQSLTNQRQICPKLQGHQKPSLFIQEAASVVSIANAKDLEMNFNHKKACSPEKRILEDQTASAEDVEMDANPPKKIKQKVPVLPTANAKDVEIDINPPKKIKLQVPALPTANTEEIKIDFNPPKNFKLQVPVLCENNDSSISEDASIIPPLIDKNVQFCESLPVSIVIKEAAAPSLTDINMEFCENVSESKRQNKAVVSISGDKSIALFEKIQDSKDPCKKADTSVPSLLDKNVEHFVDVQGSTESVVTNVPSLLDKNAENFVNVQGSKESVDENVQFLFDKNVKPSANVQESKELDTLDIDTTPSAVDKNLKSNTVINDASPSSVIINTMETDAYTSTLIVKGFESGVVVKISSDITQPNETLDPPSKAQVLSEQKIVINTKSSCIPIYESGAHSDCVLNNKMANKSIETDTKTLEDSSKVVSGKRKLGGKNKRSKKAKSEDKEYNLKIRSVKRAGEVYFSVEDMKTMLDIMKEFK